MKKIKFKLLTPLRPVYQGEVDQVTLTTSSGEITVLPNHIPLISHLVVGHVLIKIGEREEIFAIDGGILEVREDGEVIVLSDRSEHFDEIDLERAERAIQEAKEYMKNPQETGFDYSKLQAILKKEENRARIARKGHRK